MVYHHHHHTHFHKKRVLGGPEQSLLHLCAKKYPEAHLFWILIHLNHFLLHFPLKIFFLKNSQKCYSGPILTPKMVTEILMGAICSASDGLI